MDLGTEAIEAEKSRKCLLNRTLGTRLNLLRLGIPSQTYNIVELKLITYASSIFGWKILFLNPILGDLYGYKSGSLTKTFQVP